jgi:hypothetical protein
MALALLLSEPHAEPTQTAQTTATTGPPEYQFRIFTTLLPSALNWPPLAGRADTHTPAESPKKGLRSGAVVRHETGARRFIGWPARE